MSNTKILITGAKGQIGSILTKNLRQLYGKDAVVESDVLDNANGEGPYEHLDVTDTEKMTSILEKHQITQIYHLAAILSASGERNPIRTWKINMDGLLNVLELSVQKNIEKVFYPSTIAVFGTYTPAEFTPQHCNLTPTTVYGISKAAGENWCNYYNQRYGLDVRSLRYPGIISWDALPGGGTTDYAVEIFHEAIKNGYYTSYIDAETMLPMMYMPDAIKATISLMEAPTEKVKVRTSYNLAAMSFTPQKIADEIKKHIPGFTIQYNPDYRNLIAKSWPGSIDDSYARNEWGWEHEYDLESMVSDIINNLKKQL